MISYYYIISMRKRLQNNLVKDSLKNCTSNRGNNINGFRTYNCTPYNEQSHYSPDVPITSDMNTQKSYRIVLNPNSKSLKQKLDTQQVSAIYSQHIYKTMQRDYLLENQLEKLRNLLQSEKKKNHNLHAENSQLKKEKAKMAEEKKIMLFALDSLSVKIEGEDSKEKRTIRHETLQLFQGKINLNEQVQPKRASSQAEQRLSCNGVITRMNLTKEKLLLIKGIKEELNMSRKKGKANEKMKEVQEVVSVCSSSESNYQVLMLQIQNQKATIGKLQTENEEKDKRIDELQGKLEQICQSLEKVEQINKEQRCRNEELTEEISLLEQKLEQHQNQIKSKSEQIEALQIQLKLTIETYQEKESKDKQMIQSMQKFGKDLKLSDEKIQEFIKTEFGSQTQNDMGGSEKTYHQHISYIMHLYKKKEALYEHMVDELKESIKEGHFRMLILEKKLSNFSKYQEELRKHVEKDVSKDLVFRFILRFGH